MQPDTTNAIKGDNRASGGKGGCDTTGACDQAQNSLSGGFWEKLGNFVTGNGWKTDAELHPTSGDVSAATGQKIIDAALAYSGVPYSQNVSAKSTDNKPGTRTGIDCSHLVCFAAGLVYSPAKDIGNNPHLRELGASEGHQSGDIVVFGTTHVALWDASPKTAGANLLSATTHGGVTELPMYRSNGSQTFAGTPVFYRLEQ